LLKNQDIICIAGADWDNPLWTNRQHIMSRLSQQNRILYVESLGLRQPSVNAKDLSRILGKLGRLFRNIKVKGNGLFVYTPLLIPFYQFEYIRRLNDLILIHDIKKICKDLQFNKPILWSYLPNAINLVGKMGEKLVIYHCVDDLSTIKGYPMKVVSEIEKRFIQKVDIVIVTSKKLYEDKRHMNLNTYYLPNVADASHFMLALDEMTSLPQDIVKIPKPRIGYVGNLVDSKVDIKLIKYIAESHPEWSIIIIGPIWAGNKDANRLIEAIGNEKNIYCLGLKPYVELPKYIKSLDICMLPHKITEYSVSSFPIKFHEFMATGKPIVSTDLPALEDYKDIIWMAKDYPDFVKGISFLLNYDSETMKAKRVEIACQNTWEHRIESISNIIERTLFHG